ncbi:MAG: glutaredoxin family protein [Candidatus Dormibacteraeota bacterium]|nr:glutaredoxin family protein [Candidatus Dormibacteraeota bacterium]
MAVELIGRSGCGLCDEARATLRALGVDFAERDVDADPQLRQRFTDRVPVLLVDGRVAAEGRLHASSLLRALAR